MTPVFAQTKVDVAVIGGGFTGMTAARHLAEQGAKVAVLQAGIIGDGASGLNAGFVVPNFAKADPDAVRRQLGAERGDRLLRVVGQGADRVFDLIRTHAIDCDAEPVGWMHVAHSASMLAVLRTRAAAWQALDRPIRILERDDAKAVTALRHCEGALLDPSGGMLHPLDYLYGLASLAHAAGATLHEHATVDAVEPEGASWRLSIGAHRLQAKTVLLCTNASPQGVARRLARIVVPLRVYQIATEPLPREVVERISRGRNPVADTRSNLFTYRLDRDNRLITGGMAVLPIGAHDRMARALAARLARELALPSIPKVSHVWRGVAAMTTDFLPHLYAFAPGFYGGIGCNGRGIAMTAMLGEVMAEAALRRDAHDLPIPLASSRPLPFHALAQAAPSVAVAQAKWQDRALAS